MLESDIRQYEQLQGKRNWLISVLLGAVLSGMGVFLAVMLVFMVISHELLLKKCSAK
jgi:hypothetical protein